MVTKIQQKQQEAEEQIRRWKERAAETQAAHAQAMEQLVRWQAIHQVCGELLAANSEPAESAA